MNSPLTIMKPWPPVLVRLLVGRGGSWVSNRELLKDDPKARFWFDNLCKSTSWDEVPLARVHHYLSLCSFDLNQARRYREFIRRGSWAHVPRDPGPNNYGKQLLTILVRHLRQQAAQDHQPLVVPTPTDARPTPPTFPAHD